MKRVQKKFVKLLLHQIKNKTRFKKCIRNIGQDIRTWQLKTIQKPINKTECERFERALTGDCIKRLTIGCRLM